MRRLRVLALGAACACLPAGVITASAGTVHAATVGPIDVSVAPTVAPLPSGVAVQLDAGADVAVTGVPQVGVDTSVGVAPMAGVDAKVDLSTDGQPRLQAGAGVPLTGAPPHVDVALPPPNVLPIAPPAPTFATALPLASTGGHGTTSATRDEVSSPLSPADASRLHDSESSTSRHHSPRNAAIDPSAVSATIDAPHRGVWSSLGHSAATFGPWVLLLALAAVVELVAKAAVRDQRARRGVVSPATR